MVLGKRFLVFYKKIIILNYPYTSFFAALSVFFISDTMVSGPTPPGTGVI
jgi:hypothetical protein